MDFLITFHVVEARSAVDSFEMINVKEIGNSKHKKLITSSTRIRESTDLIKEATESVRYVNSFY